MTPLRSLFRRPGAAALVVGLAAALPVLFAATASAQTTDCPAGAPGGPGGNAGRSVAGNGGLAFNIGPLADGTFATSTTPLADASGGAAGSSEGGLGGRGGSG